MWGRCGHPPIQTGTLVFRGGDGAFEDFVVFAVVWPLSRVLMSFMGCRNTNGSFVLVSSHRRLFDTSTQLVTTLYSHRFNVKTSKLVALQHDIRVSYSVHCCGTSNSPNRVYNGNTQYFTLFTRRLNVNNRAGCFSTASNVRATHVHHTGGQANRVRLNVVGMSRVHDNGN